MASRTSRAKKTVDYSKFDDDSDDADDFEEVSRKPKKSESKPSLSKESSQKKKKKMIDDDDEFKAESENNESSDATVKLEQSDDSEWEDDPKPVVKNTVKSKTEGNKENISTPLPSKKLNTGTKSKAKIAKLKDSAVIDKSPAVLEKSADLSLPRVSLEPQTPAPIPRPLNQIKCFTPPTRPNPISSPASSIQKTPGGSVGSLRLGLSRKQAVKPLHSNVRLAN